GAAVAHGRSQAADELVDDVGERALVDDPALDALGDQLVLGGDVALEVAVLRVRAGLHGAHRAHAPVLLEPLALVEDHVAGRLVDAGEQAAEHDRVRPGGDGLGDVAGVLDAAVGDDRGPVAGGGVGGVVHRGDLGDAHPGDDAGRADRPGADTHLHGVRAG